jgi:hypothetical protein
MALAQSIVLPAFQLGCVSGLWEAVRDSQSPPEQGRLSSSRRLLNLVLSDILARGDERRACLRGGALVSVEDGERIPDCRIPWQRSSRAGSIGLVVDGATAPPESDSPSAAEPTRRRARANADQGSWLRQARGWHGLRQSGGGLWCATWILRATIRRHCWERVRSSRSGGATAPSSPSFASRPTRRTAGAVAPRRWAGIALRRCGASRSPARKEGEDRCRRTGGGRLGSSQAR